MFALANLISSPIKVMKKVWIDQTRIGLSLYDPTGDGYLSESDLETYALELIPTLPQVYRVQFDIVYMHWIS